MNINIHNSDARECSVQADSKRSVSGPYLILFILSIFFF